MFWQMVKRNYFCKELSVLKVDKHRGYHYYYFHASVETSDNLYLLVSFLT